MWARLFKMIDELYKDLKLAEERIVENRLLAWIPNCSTKDCNGLELKPLTARAWIELKLVKNKFVTSGNAQATDAMEYIWRNCIDYSPQKTANTEKLKKKIGYMFSRSDDDEILNVVYRHINDAFAELPKSQNTSKSFSRSNKMPEVEGIIGAVDEVAARYGQNPFDILGWPLNRVFQLQKAIRVATIPNYKLAEPQLIKIIKQEILTLLNNGTESRT